MNNLLRTTLLAFATTALVACSSGVKLDDAATAQAPIEDRSARSGSSGASGSMGQGGMGQGGMGQGGMGQGGRGQGGMGQGGPGDQRGVARVDNTAARPSTPPIQTIAELQKRSVYFDFDSYNVSEQYRPVIEAHARYLLANRNAKVIIQGNTDERGGSEYNLALGQRRAEAVRRSIQLMGVPEAQMEAISFGKEKPRAQGRDEAAWAENRRADLVYQ